MTATLDRPVIESPVLDRTVEVEPGRLRRLRVFNAVMGVLHLVSGGLMVALGNDFELPVGTLNRAGPPGVPLDEWTVESVIGIRLAWVTASFLWLSALFHFIVATVGFGRYGDELAHGRNRFRWVEYALSSTVMIVVIAQLTGIVDLAALVAIAFANVAMILFGWIMEMVNPPDRRAWWTPFTFGSIAGIGPWVAIVGYLAFNVAESGEGPPGFVYGILVSIFVLFNCFAVNQWLQYRRIGRWRDYVYGEVAYIVLSLVAKSALAWQIFANTLID